MKLVLDGRIVLPRMTGAGRYVIELAQRLPGLSSALVVDVILLPAMRATPIPAILEAAGARIHYVDVRVASLRQWLVIPRVLRRLQPDLYHYPFLDLPYVAVPSVVTIYDLNPILHPEYFGRLAPLKRPVARQLVRSTLRRSRCALAISDATRDLVRQHYPESAHKVRTTHLGVDPAAWTEEPGRSAQTPPLWHTRPYILYVGVDRPHKNLVRLVRAFGRLRTQQGWTDGAGPYLWLAGVGEGSAPLQSEVAVAALNRDVRLDAALSESEVRAAYHGATAVAYISTSEGFGLPVLEAFAAGVPVVAADVSSLPEVGGSAAVYVNPHDEIAIAGALQRVWTDPDLRRTLVERGRERAREFTWDATAAATVAAYYDALGVGAARSDMGSRGVRAGPPR